MWLCTSHCKMLQFCVKTRDSHSIKLACLLYILQLFCDFMVWYFHDVLLVMNLTFDTGCYPTLISMYKFPPIVIVLCNCNLSPWNCASLCHTFFHWILLGYCYINSLDDKTWSGNFQTTCSKVAPAQGLRSKLWNNVWKPLTVSVSRNLSNNFLTS